MSLLHKTISRAQHTARVKSLYKKIVKTQLDFIVERERWYGVARVTRELFDKNKSVSDTAEADKLYEEASELLQRCQHPQPYIHPYRPGGSYYLRYYPASSDSKADFKYALRSWTNDDLEQDIPDLSDLIEDLTKKYASGKLKHPGLRKVFDENASYENITKELVILLDKDQDAMAEIKEILDDDFHLDLTRTGHVLYQELEEDSQSKVADWSDTNAFVDALKGMNASGNVKHRELKGIFQEGGDNETVMTKLAVLFMKDNSAIKEVQGLVSKKFFLGVADDELVLGSV